MESKPVSLADQWKRHQQAKAVDPTRPVDLELPSGLSVRVTRTSLLLLMRRGAIPDALLPRVESLIRAAQDGGEDAVRVEMNQALATNPGGFQAEWTRILNAVWMATVVEPRFTDDAASDPDAIPIDVVNENDKTYLFSWCQGVTESVASFRDRSRARADAALGGPSMGDDLRSRPGDLARDRPEA